MSLAPSLPELVTDSERLRTVLVNLLTNADHAIEGRPSAAVTLITQHTGDRRVCVTIRDTGKGIAEDDLSRIFDPYFTTRRAGTGLGLAIAKNIVEGLGGSISVATQPRRRHRFPHRPRRCTASTQPRWTLHESAWLAASFSQTTKKKS